MATNNFLPFCPTDTGTNLLSQSDYSAATDRTSGNKPGVASAKLNNKALRQATFATGQLAQFLSDITGTDTLDDGVSARFLSQLKAALQAFAPNYTKYTSGSGTWNMQYYFFIASGNATAGATYTNNGVTYTVVSTVAAGTLVKMTGNSDPTVSGTLTKASGTGDATLTFYANRKPIYLEVNAVGGGAGGNGSGRSSTYGVGGAGGNTTFGTTLIVANGGGAGASQSPGSPGTASLGTGPVGTATTGAVGTGSGFSNVTTAGTAGSPGASTPFGGGGGGGYANAVAGSAAAANTGAGGGGGGYIQAGAAGFSGVGGSTGGYVLARINTPLSTYAYAVGAAGAAGTAGTDGAVGGAGGSGLIEVIEHYQ